MSSYLKIIYCEFWKIILLNLNIKIKEI